MKRISSLTGLLLMIAAPLWAAVLTDYMRDETGTMVGSVSSLNSQTLVLSPDDGQQQTFAIDSRSMVPDEMPAGKRVRVQFKLLDNGTYFAQRVTPIEAWEETGTTPMRAENELSGTDQMSATDQIQVDQMTTTTTTTTETSTQATEPAPTETQTYESKTTTDETVQTHDQDHLPKTASPLPLLALIAFIALATGGALWLRRRLRDA